MSEEVIKPVSGICVDGGTVGNPGPCFYQGVDLATGSKLFYQHLGEGTNNIAEFLAIVHAIYYCSKNDIEPNIWSDSKTAIAWVRHKNCNSTFNGDIKTRLVKACNYLNSINSVEINKWATKKWGEIPADFGRK
jgi:ribonuclease HI